MNFFKLTTLTCIALSFCVPAAYAGPLDKLKKKYTVSAQKNGYHKITSKKKPYKIGFVRPDGKIALKPRENIYSHAFSCGTVLTGDPILGPNDGGGRFRRGVRNAKLLNITTGTETALGYNVVNAIGTHLHQDKYHEELLRVYETEDQVGLYDACGGLISEMRYSHINEFSNQGYAIAFTPTDMTVLDSTGREILDTRFKHNVDLSKIDVTPIFGRGATWRVQDNVMMASRDGRKWGLYNIATKRDHTPFIYDEIARSDERENVTYYRVAKNDKVSIIDKVSGQLLAPLYFDNFHSRYKLNGTYYFVGSNDVIDSRIPSAYNGIISSYNVIRESDGRTLLPQGRKYTNIKQFSNDGQPARWRVFTSDYNVVRGGLSTRTNVGIFDETTRSFLLEPQSGHGDQITSRNVHYVLTRTWAEEGVVLNADFKPVTDYHPNINSGHRYELINGTRRTNLYVAMAGGNVAYFYGDNKKFLFEARVGSAPKVEIRNNQFVIEERADRTFKKFETCLDENYDIVGERFKCGGSAPRMSDGLSSGDKLPALACDHQMFRRKLDLAPKSSISVSSTFCRSGECYDKKRVVDGDRSTKLGGAHSWTNDGEGPKWMELKWSRPVKNMEQVYFVSTDGYEIGNYDISVESGGRWLKVASVRNNTALKPCHRFPPTDVTKVRIEGTGPARQPAYMRLNEVVIR